MADADVSVCEHCVEALGDIGLVAVLDGLLVFFKVFIDVNMKVCCDVVWFFGYFGDVVCFVVVEIKKLLVDLEKIVCEVVGNVFKVVVFDEVVLVENVMLGGKVKLDVD